MPSQQEQPPSHMVTLPNPNVFKGQPDFLRMLEFQDEVSLETQLDTARANRDFAIDRQNRLTAAMEGNKDHRDHFVAKRNEGLDNVAGNLEQARARLDKEARRLEVAKAYTMQHVADIDDTNYSTQQYLEERKPFLAAMCEGVDALAKAVEIDHRLLEEITQRTTTSQELRAKGRSLDYDLHQHDDQSLQSRNEHQRLQGYHNNSQIDSGVFRSAEREFEKVEKRGIELLASYRQTKLAYGENEEVLRVRREERRALRAEAARIIGGLKKLAEFEDEHLGRIDAELLTQMEATRARTRKFLDGIALMEKTQLQLTPEVARPEIGKKRQDSSEEMRSQVANYMAEILKKPLNELGEPVALEESMDPAQIHNPSVPLRAALPRRPQAEIVHEAQSVQPGQRQRARLE